MVDEDIQDAQGAPWTFGLGVCVRLGPERRHGSEWGRRQNTAALATLMVTEVGPRLKFFQHPARRASYGAIMQADCHNALENFTFNAALVYRILLPESCSGSRSVCSWPP